MHKNTHPMWILLNKFPPNVSRKNIHPLIKFIYIWALPLRGKACDHVCSLHMHSTFSTGSKHVDSRTRTYCQHPSKEVFRSMPRSHRPDKPKPNVLVHAVRHFHYFPHVQYGVPPRFGDWSMEWCDRSDRLHNCQSILYQTRLTRSSSHNPFVLGKRRTTNLELHLMPWQM